MIGFFKTVDPFRITILLILFFLLKLPDMIWGSPLTIPELSAMITGEKLSESVTMYSGVMDTSAPLFAGTYYLLAKMFGQSVIGYHILAMLITLIQAIAFNQIVNQAGLFREKTLLPTLFFAVFSTILFDFLTLSPVIIGMSFLLMSLNLLFAQLKIEQQSDNHYYIGLLIGIAAMFYIPMAIFVLFFLLCLGLYSTLDIKKAFILLSGFIMPFFLIWVYYYLNDASDDLVYCLIYSLFNISFPDFHQWKDLLIPALIPMALFFVSFLLILTSGTYVNYQLRCIRVMYLWIFFSVLMLLSGYGFYPALLYILIPTFTFMCTHLFLLIRRTVVSDLLGGTAIIVMLIIHYNDTSDFSENKYSTIYENYIVKEDSANHIKNKRLLVLGDDVSAYKDNMLATPYLNWALAQKDFSTLDDYKNIGQVYEKMEKDRPEIIIDETNTMPKIIYRIPAYGLQFKLKDDKSTVYERRD